MGFLSGWDYRRKLTIPNAKADSTESAFPADVYLKGEDFNFDKAMVNGHDVRFTQSDGETLLKFERIRHGLGYYEEQCSVASGHGGQGLVADDDYFYWGHSNGVGVNGTIFKVTHSGVDVDWFEGPPHSGDGDILPGTGEEDDTLLFCSGSSNTPELWKISKTGTKLDSWDLSGVDHPNGRLVAVKDANTVYYLTRDGDWLFKIREITLYSGGTYDLGDVWEHEADIGVLQGIAYKEGYLWLLYGNGSYEGIKISVLQLEDDGDITFIDTYDTDLDDEEAEGLSWLGETLYFGSLNYKIRKWDRIAYYRVKIPSVSDSQDTEIYMYYGNDGAADGADPDNVYDANFVSVHNLIEKGSGVADEFEDSTSNDNHGQGNAGTQSKVPERTQGLLFKAQDFDSDDDYINLDDAPYDITGVITVEALVRVEELGAAQHILSKAEGAAYFLALTSGNKFQFSVHDGAAWKNATADDIVTINTWYYVVGVWDGSNVLLYVDSVLQADQEPFAAGAISTNNYDANIGRNPGASPGEWWGGKISFVAVSDTDRSAGWIKLAYYSATNTLFTYGNEEAGIPAYKYLFGRPEMVEQGNKYLFGDPELLAVESQYLFGEAEMAEQGNKYLFGFVEAVLGNAQYLYGSVTIVDRIPKPMYGRRYQRLSSVKKEVT